MEKNWGEWEYSSAIREFRYDGNIDQAIRVCDDAIARYPNNNFFYKLLGDMYVQKGDYGKASGYYLEQLRRLGNKPEQFRSFARFYKLFSECANDDEVRKYRKELQTAIEKHEIPSDISGKLASLMGEEFLEDPELKELKELIVAGKPVNEIRKGVDQLLKEQKLDKFRALLQYRVGVTVHTNNLEVDKVLIAAAERVQMYDQAVALIRKNQRPLKVPTMIRALLRICRKQQDYAQAEELLKLDGDFVSKSDFNIQYELVYYFEFKRNQELLEQTLKAMRSGASRSVPIARTLYNFYLRFNMFPEAKLVSEHIKNLEEKRKQGSTVQRIEEQFESEQGVWDKLQELVSEQEHNRQMIAMRDLIRGFSHELGQPVTNIRYSIQLYNMRMRAGKVEEGDIDTLLRLILHQTERIGDMLDRFRPIVSSRNVVETFGVYERIQRVFKDMEGRLQEQGVQYILNGDKALTLSGEAVQFDQIFYNLILNAMQAIGPTDKKGLIRVQVSDNEKNEIQIAFSDNGPGISEENAKKVFEPFFTTKDPSADNGGEGLGLFIVWNILKMFDGRISLDTRHQNGAKFIMTIAKQQEVKDE